MKSGNLKFLETSGPLQACNGTALPLPLLLHIVGFTQKSIYHKEGRGLGRTFIVPQLPAKDKGLCYFRAFQSLPQIGLYLILLIGLYRAIQSCKV